LFRHFAAEPVIAGKKNIADSIFKFDDRARRDSAGDPDLIGTRIRASRLGTDWTDEAGDAELCKAAAGFLTRGEQLPPSLREPVLRVLRNLHAARKRAPAGTGYEFRDLVIAFAIGRVHKKWGFPATRHSREHGHGSALISATSIVRAALAEGANVHKTEGAIDKIWRRWLNAPPVRKVSS
jgi:hypothetical protein